MSPNAAHPRYHVCLREKHSCGNSFTGGVNWHYQSTLGDNWDYTAVQDIALADMEVDGRMRKVVLQAPQNGFLYVIDWANGGLLCAHPFEP